MYLERLFGTDNGVESDNVRANQIKRILKERLRGDLDNPARLEIKAPVDFPIMLGIVPIDNPPIRNVNGREDATRYAEIFPAFRSIVKRTVLLSGASDANSEDRGQIDQDSWLYGIPGGLPVIMFWDEEVPYGTHEKQYLEHLQQNRYVHLLGPLPESTRDIQENEEELHDRLAGVVIRPPLVSLGNTSGAGQYQVLHFVAHSAVDPDNIDAASIKLARIIKKNVFQLFKRELQTIELSSGSLKRVADRLRHPRLDAGPIAVLSSCEGIAASHLGDRSLVARFLRLGYRAVVGTETSIPGKLGFDFTKSFYRALTGGSSVGLAVHQAQVDMLNSENGPNPMGILFGTFGNTDLVKSDFGW